MIPTVESLAKFNLRSANKWVVSLSNWNNINAKKAIAPVTSVTFLNISPVTEEITVGPGIPIVLQYGARPTQEVNITLLENSALTVQGFLNNYAKGGVMWNGKDSPTYNLKQFEGIPITTLYEKPITMEITQFDITERVATPPKKGKSEVALEEDGKREYIFSVIPKDGLSISLDQDPGPLSYNISFYVLGRKDF